MTKRDTIRIALSVCEGTKHLDAATYRRVTADLAAAFAVNIPGFDAALWQRSTANARELTEGAAR